MGHWHAGIPARDAVVTMIFRAIACGHVDAPISIAIRVRSDRYGTVTDHKEVSPVSKSFMKRMSAMTNT